MVRITDNGAERLAICVEHLDIRALDLGRIIGDALQKHELPITSRLDAPNCLVDLPSADARVRGRRREHEHDCVGVPDQAAEAALPILAPGNAVAVDRKNER